MCDPGPAQPSLAGCVTSANLLSSLVPVLPILRGGVGVWGNPLGPYSRSPSESKGAARHPWSLLLSFCLTAPGARGEVRAGCPGGLPSLADPLPASELCTYCSCCLERSFLRSSQGSPPHPTWVSAQMSPPHQGQSQMTLPSSSTITWGWSVLPIRLFW